MTKEYKKPLSTPSFSFPLAKDTETIHAPTLNYDTREKASTPGSLWRSGPSFDRGAKVLGLTEALLS